MSKHLRTALLALLFLFIGAPMAWADPLDDIDGDGLIEELEDAFGSSDNDSTSDLDGWDDWDEVFEHGTSPSMEDTDGDGTWDDSDSEPLIYNGGSLGGSGSPSHASLPTTELWAPSGESATDGHNVHVHNGCFVYSTPVASANGVVLPFNFGMKYISQANYNGPTGMNWISMLDLSISIQGNGDGLMVFPDGIKRTWVKNGSDFDPITGIRGVLDEPVSGEYRWTTPEGFEYHFGSNGKLSKFQDPYGNATTLTWLAGKATKATDSRGEDHTFAYYSSGRLKTITMADGRIWTFVYTLTNQLARIEGPATTTFGTGIVWEFRYTNGSSTGSLNHNMTHAIDGKGQVWLQMTYDQNDRVDWQRMGVEDFEFDYTNIATYETTVTDRAGNDRVWEWHSTKLTKTKLEQESNRNVRTGDPTSWDTSWTHDSDGYRLTVEYPEGNGIKYTLNAQKLPAERRHKAVMSAADSATDDLIHTWTYHTSNNYAVDLYTDPEGNETDRAVNTDGQVTSITYETLTNVSPSATVTESFTYNTDGTLLTRTDGEGVVTKYEYYTTPTAKKGRIKKVIVDEGTGKLNLTTEYDYTDWGQVKEVTDPEGNVTEHTIEAYGNITKTEFPSALGYETRYTQDANLNVITKLVKNIDEDGTAQSNPAFWKTTYTYTEMDLLERLREYTDATNYRETQYTYDDNDNVEEFRRDSYVVEMTYDERDLLYQRIKDPGTGAAIDATETFTYDDNGNLSTYSDPRSKETTHTYDLFDRRTKTINALDDYETVSYDKNGRVTETKFYEEAGTTDTLMRHTKRSYDEMRRFYKEERALIDTTTTWITTTLTLDKRGLVVGVEDPRSNDTTLTYDNARRRLSMEDALGNETEYEYDDNGNVTEVSVTETIPGSGSTETFVTEYTYDEINRRTKQTVIDRTDATNKKITEWKYNSRNVLAVLVDPKGYETTNTHDGLGRMTKQSVDLGSGSAIVTEWTFNDNDLVTQLKDDNGHTTDYEYDNLNRLDTKTYDDLSTVTYAYDDAGNLTNMVDRAGNDIDYGYSDINQLTGRDATLAAGFSGDTEEDFTYDALGRLTQAKDDDSIVEFTYDSLGRVQTEKQGDNPFGSSGKTVTYSHDNNGNVTQIDYPAGFEAHRTFDAINRLTLIEDDMGADIADFDLYGAGARRKQVTFENSTASSYVYDGFRRATDISHETSGSTEFAGFEYGWDKNDNPTYEERSHQSGKGDVYTYDKANRLTQVLEAVVDPANEVANPGTESYDDKVAFNMDDVLNFTSIVTTPYGGSSSTESYTSNGMNEYSAVGGQTHTYDDNGNLKTDGANTYTYSWKNQLIKVVDTNSSTTVATYDYDCYGLGRRTEKVVGSDTTRFVYADQQCIEEYDGSDNLRRTFAFGVGLDEIVMMEAPDIADVDSDLNTTEIKRFYYHGQLIGSITHITDEDEAVVESYDYSPYGQIEIFDINDSAVAGTQIGNPFTYTGRRFDEESGLYYYRARYYSAELRRFVTTDRHKREYVDGPNRYGYVRARVTSGVDPSGLVGSYIGPGGEIAHPFEDPGLSADLPDPKPTGQGERKMPKKPAWVGDPPPGTHVIRVPPGPPDKVGEAFEEEAGGDDRRWPEDAIKTIKAQLCGGWRGYTYAAEGEDEIYIGVVGPNLKRGTDEEERYWRLLFHEFGHAWFSRWVFEWLGRKGGWSAKKADRVLEDFKKAYEGKGDDPVPVDTPAGDIDVPQTHHGEKDPYGLPKDGGGLPWPK